MAIITTTIKCMVSDERFDPMLVNDLQILLEDRTSSGRTPIFCASVHVPAGSPRRSTLPSKFVRALLEHVSTPEFDAVDKARKGRVYVRLSPVTKETT